MVMTPQRFSKEVLCLHQVTFGGDDKDITLHERWGSYAKSPSFVTQLENLKLRMTSDFIGMVVVGDRSLYSSTLLCSTVTRKDECSYYYRSSSRQQQQAAGLLFLATTSPHPPTIGIRRSGSSRCPSITTTLPLLHQLVGIMMRQD